MSTPTATFAGTPLKLITSAGTNGANKIPQTAKIWGWDLANTSAAWKYVKIHDVAGAVTVGTTPVLFTIGIPPNGKASYCIDKGLELYNGLGWSVTNLPADNDTTAVAANDVIGHIAANPY